jgi:hypothetical protein
MGEWRYSSNFLDLSTRWRWVVGFTPRPFNPRGKSPQYPLDRRLGGPQSRSGRCGGAVASRYADWDTPTCRKATIQPRSGGNIQLTNCCAAYFIFEILNWFWCVFEGVSEYCRPVIANWPIHEVHHPRSFYFRLLSESPMHDVRGINARRVRRVSVCLHVSARDPLDGLSWNLILEHFKKNSNGYLWRFCTVKLMCHANLIVLDLIARCRVQIVKRYKSHLRMRHCIWRSCDCFQGKPDTE